MAEDLERSAYKWEEAEGFARDGCGTRCRLFWDDGGCKRRCSCVKYGYSAFPSI